jgi:hypothetical protein
MSHKEWILVAVAESGRNGAVHDLGAISNDLHALEKLLGRLRKGYGPDVIIWACYEAGPCGFGITRRLRQLGVECAVGKWKARLSKGARSLSARFFGVLGPAALSISALYPTSTPASFCVSASVLAACN